MLIEKRTKEIGSASPRVFFLAVGAGLLLFVLGTAAAAFTSVGDEPTPTPTPIGTATPVAGAPTPTPTFASPTPTLSPTPTPVAPASVADARAAYTAKDYPKAIQIYAQAVTEAQGAIAIAQLQYELGNSYRENKQNDEALSTYALAITQNPQLIVAYQARANLLVALKRRDEAKLVLEAGLQANPGNQDLQRDLSTLQLSGGGGE